MSHLHRFVPRNEIVFEIKASGAEFFIILDGLVEFYVEGNPDQEPTRTIIEKMKKEEPLAPEERPDVSRTKSNYKGVPPTKAALRSQVLKYPTLGQQILFDGVPMTKIPVQNSTGSSFGELALTGSKTGQQRRGTVLARQDCHFAILHREHYDMITGDATRKQMAMKKKMLRGAYYFASCSEKFLDSIQRDLVPKKYSMGQVVYNWEQPVASIFFVQEGQVKLLRRKDLIGPTDEQKMLLRLQQKPLEERIPSHMCVRAMKTTAEYIEIAQREQNQSFYEENFVLESPSNYKVVCNSETCIVCELPFQSLDTALKSFEMFREGIFTKILAHHDLLQEWSKRAQTQYRIRGLLPREAFFVEDVPDLLSESPGSRQQKEGSQSSKSLFQ